MVAAWEVWLYSDRLAALLWTYLQSQRINSVVVVLVAPFVSRGVETRLVGVLIEAFIKSLPDDVGISPASTPPLIKTKQHLLFNSALHLFDIPTFETM